MSSYSGHSIELEICSIPHECTKFTTVQNPSRNSSFPVLETLTRSGPRFTHFWPSLQRHNWPTNSAREVFISSTDSVSLLVSIKKNISFGWGVFFEGRHKVRLFFEFWPNLTGPGRQSNEPKFYRKHFVKATWSSASIEPLIDFLECLEPKLWPQNSVVHKNQKSAWVSHRRLCGTR